jgi:hypothetical protein
MEILADWLQSTSESEGQSKNRYNTTAFDLLEGGKLDRKTDLKYCGTLPVNKKVETFVTSIYFSIPASNEKKNHRM